MNIGGPDDLIHYRLNQARAILNDAKLLAEANGTPLSIVNRSYYAMFYAALALMENIKRIPSKHSGVLNLFDTEFYLKGIFPKELSQVFHEAFNLRQESDYKVREPVSMETALDIMQKAFQFVDAILDYLIKGEGQIP